MNDSQTIKEPDGQIREFESLYHQHFQDVFQYMVHCIGSVQDAEDATAQVFLKALKSLWRYRWTRGSFSSWLFRIAHNEMKSYFRKKKRLGRLWSFSENLEDFAPMVNELARAEHQCKQDEFYVSLQRNMMELTPDECSLLVLRFFQNKSYREMEPVFKLKSGALAMRVHRALHKLKSQLIKEGMDHETFRRSFENMSEA